MPNLLQSKELNDLAVEEALELGDKQALLDIARSLANHAGPKDEAFRSRRRANNANLVEVERSLESIRARKVAAESRAQARAQTDAGHLVRIARIATSYENRLAYFAARIDLAGGALADAVVELKKFAAARADLLVESVSALSDDPAAINAALGPVLSKARAQDSFLAKAVASLFAHIVQAADVRVPIGDYVVFNSHSDLERGPFFTDVAEANAQAISTSLRDLLVRQGIEPDAIAAHVAAAGPQLTDANGPVTAGMAAPVGFAGDGTVTDIEASAIASALAATKAAS